MHLAYCDSRMSAFQCRRSEIWNCRQLLEGEVPSSFVEGKKDLSAIVVGVSCSLC